MSVSRRRVSSAPVYDSLVVKAGVLVGATYPQQELTNAATGEKVPDARAGMPVAVIAAALNYGTSKIPPRPFMNVTVSRERKAWADGVVKLIMNGMSEEEALTTIGQVMKEDIQRTINDWPADNSKEWAEFKGFSKGLIFTSHLLNSIDSAVVPKKGS